VLRLGQAKACKLLTGNDAFGGSQGIRIVSRGAIGLAASREGSQGECSTRVNRYPHVRIDEPQLNGAGSEPKVAEEG
jgi:hypothetical protein